MSTETALHSLVTRLEKGVVSKEIALGVFLDIEGAFNNTSFDSINTAAERFGIDATIVRWIRAMLESRVILTSIGSAEVSSTVTRGCPQGGVLSPLLWCLVLDELLDTLNTGGIYAQGYADDLALVVTGKFANTVREIMQRALRQVERWCTSHGLSVNPEKTKVVTFTRRRKLGLGELTLGGTQLRPTVTVKYLGVLLDSGLTWREQVENVVRKATACLWACRRAIGSTWGLQPHIVHWLYTAVIRPMITYGAIVWWHAGLKVTYRRKLDKLQRLACLAVTGALKTTPTLSMEAILGLEPLHIFVESEARRASIRLNDWCQWTDKGSNYGHTRIWSEMIRADPLLERRDAISPVLTFQRKYRVIVPDRGQWQNPNPSFLRPEGLVWYTDGSRTEDGSGAGIYGDRPRERLSVPLGQYTTVFQAEILAIMVCAQENLARGYSNKHIYICSDSQAALMALASTRVNTKTTLECRRTLGELCESNKVNLIWVPGHSDIEGNERADELAREGSATAFTGPEPALGIASSTVKTRIRNWATARFQVKWREQEGLIQSRVFIKEPWSKSESRRLLRLSRDHLRAFVGVLTGHWLVNYHLHNIRLSDESECRFCGEAEETTEHIVCWCESLTDSRLRTLGDRYLEPRDVRLSKPERVCSFMKKIGLLG